MKRALLIVAALLFAGPGTAGAQAPMSLTVELGDVSATKLPFVVAYETGIYSRNGLDVTQFITPAAADSARENGVNVPAEFVKSGVIGDINIGGGSPTLVRMTSIATAPQRIILATNDNKATIYVFARTGINSLAELKGKRVGYGNLGATDNLSYYILARKMGWDPLRDWTMLSGVHGAESALKSKIDVFMGDPTVKGGALKIGYHEIAEVSTLGVPILGSGVNAMKSWLPSHRAAAAAFVKSTVEAMAVIKNDKPTTIAAMTKWYGLTDQTRLEEIYNQAIRLPSKPYPSVEGLKVIRSIYLWRDMVDHPVSYFMDPSFMTALDKSGYIDSLYKK